MLKETRLSLIFFALIQMNLAAQNPVVDFDLPSGACLSQHIFLKNTSTGATSYAWDFCPGDLGMTPLGTRVVNVGGNVTTGIEVVSDNGNWFGFVTSRATNSILRLDFGTNLSSTPVIEDLGNISSVLNSPIDIQVVKEGSEWFGFVYGESSSLLSRIDFGETLNADPLELSATLILSGAGTSNSGLTVKKSAGKWNLICTFSNAIKIIRLADIRDLPAGPDILDVAVPFSSSLGDITLIQNANGDWFAYAADFGNHAVFRFSFGSDIFSNPQQSNFSSGDISVFTPYGVDSGVDGGNYFLFLSTIEGPVVRVPLGTDLALSPGAGSSLGNLGVLDNTLKVKLIHHESSWYAFFMSWNSSQLLRADFPSPPCASTQAFSTSDEPVIQFNTPGNVVISLEGFDGSEQVEMHHQISVSSSVAPTIDFENQQACTQIGVQFVVDSSQPLQSQSWDFDNGETSTMETPQTIYLSPGEYSVRLDVIAENGCGNTSIKPVSIFNPPAPSFVIPSGLLCSNTGLNFENTTPGDFGALVQWEWSLGDGAILNTKDVQHVYDISDQYTVQLTASIPGCSGSVSESINLLEGAKVDFDFANICYNQETTFTNLTTGSQILGYEWHFDDGATSTDESPDHIFSATGQYAVTLEASHVSGCVNQKTQDVVIYSNPATDFFMALPPFSCSGTSTQFNDLTPPPGDSNLDSWSWNFGDPSSGTNTSSQKNPQHIFASATDYTVALTVSTEFGCTATTQKTVTISQSADGNFTNTASCTNQPTMFTGPTDPGILSYAWQIGSTPYSQPNPSHQFSAPNTYNVSLTVTGTNGCETITSKQLTVPVAPTLSYDVTKNCVGQDVVFTNSSQGSSDGIASTTWLFNGTTSASGSPATHVFSSTGSFPVRMTTTTNSGCSYILQQPVQIVNAPVASFEVPFSLGAPPFFVPFTNNSTNATSYLWHFGDALGSTSLLTSPQFTFLNIGEYSVSLDASNSNACKTTATLLLNVLNPMPDIIIHDLGYTEQSDGLWMITTAVENNGNLPVQGLTLNLDLTTASINESVNQVILPGETIHYTFNTKVLPTASMRYLCVDAPYNGDLASYNNKECISLDDAFLFYPHPNPVDNELILDWISQSEENVTLRLTDASGHQIFVETILAKKGFNSYSIEARTLQAGVYVVEWKSQALHQSRKVIVSH